MENICIGDCLIPNNISVKPSSWSFW
jgi:hypothetical protein